MTKRNRNWFKDYAYRGALVILGIVAIMTIIISLTGGCAQMPQQKPHTSLVFGVHGTLDDPKVGWEYSRNDERLNVHTDEELASERERYLRQLSITIRSVDRQRTNNGRPGDHFFKETRIRSK